MRRWILLFCFFASSVSLADDYKIVSALDRADIRALKKVIHRENVNHCYMHCTPIMHAVMKVNPGMAEFLLGQGASPNKECHGQNAWDALDELDEAEKVAFVELFHKQGFSRPSSITQPPFEFSPRLLLFVVPVVLLRMCLWNKVYQRLQAALLQ